jgi:YVTN family beta-propeller protein
MILTFAALALLQAIQPEGLRRSIGDSGIIATAQRVTPAGVQSVFAGRVGGVRFGVNSGELWVAVPNNVYRLGWRDNQVLAHAPFDGSTGVMGVAFDQRTGRAIVSQVVKRKEILPENRTPGSVPLERTRMVAQLTTYTGDGKTAHVASVALGEFMNGAPAIAHTANATGHRVVVVPLPANDRLAVLDADGGQLLSTISLGVLPVAAVVSADGAVAWVTVFGGAKPARGVRAASQCCDPSAEPVRVDERGIAEPGQVVRVDLVKGRVTDSVVVGRHPAGLAWDEDRARLYVANGNSSTVSVIDTRQNRLFSTIDVSPFRERKVGLAPNAVAASLDGSFIYVTLGGGNAVAVFDVANGKHDLKGLIPTGWYPSSIDLSPDGKTLAVGALLGVGSGQGQTSGHPGKRAGYVHANRGSVNVITIPTEAQLAAYTTGVALNNGLTLTGGPAAPMLTSRDGIAALAVPERPGEPSLIEHVVFIVRENRTYDQVFGDIGRGASDPTLTMYGGDVTPNAHALADEFVLLDHFFASGGNSADGHQWLTQANETEYAMWPLYLGRSYPSEGNDPLTYSSGGFLWEAAQARGRSVSIFGEYAPAPSQIVPSARETLMKEYRDRQPHDAVYFREKMKKMFDTRSGIPSLDRTLVREYPGWTMEVPDVIKADIFLEHIREWEAARTMPDLVMVILPSDHTEGTNPGWCTPKACVADNDLALGQIVEGLTHSSFWKQMAVLVVEDDAQNGVDHIDGHRTVALAISPYTKRRSIDSTFYGQPSLLKTIELMLGLPALSLFDLVATDMRASFIDERGHPDFTPYDARLPQQSIYELNQRLGEIAGPHAAQRKSAALASSRMKWNEPDAAPSDRLNRILWYDAKGWGRRFPGVRYSYFFPLAVDIRDEERGERDR